MKIEISESEATLLDRLLRAHVKDLGERQQKPRGYTYNRVISELEDSAKLIARIANELP